MVKCKEEMKKMNRQEIFVEMKPSRSESLDSNIENEKRGQANACNKNDIASIQECSLRRHLKTGEKSHTCDQCDFVSLQNRQ